MKYFLLIATLALGLAMTGLTGCDAITGKVTPESVVAEIQKDCGIVVNVGDIVALVTANPAIAGISAFAKMVCDAFHAQKASAKSDAKTGTLVVNGVDVHYVVK